MSGIERIGTTAKRVAGAVLFLATAWAAPVDGVCINEILYDPSGADAGREFIELYNPDSTSQELHGWSLEAGNGAQPGDWRRQWEGGAPDRIGPRGFFLIAGAAFEGVADARAPLDMQNGPDAVRLRAPSGWTDRVGWGELEHEEFFEGVPAPDAPSGSTLARIPDGLDRDDNRSDLRICPQPTPGRANAGAGGIDIDQVRCVPPILDAGGTGELSVTVTDGGSEIVDLGELRWVLDGPGLRVDVRRAPVGMIRPGESAVFVWALRPLASEGAASVRISLTGPGGERSEALAPVWIGRGEVWISEIQYDPSGSDGEWIELAFGGTEPIDLAGWQIRDASGRGSTIGPGPVMFEPRGCALVAESPGGLRASWPELSPEAILPRTGGWPSLNNSLDRELGYADQILLLEADGTPVDYVNYVPGDLDGGGVSLERWIEASRLIDPFVLVPCASPRGSTPGFTGWVPPQGSLGGSGIRPDPNPFFAGREGGPRLCRIVLSAPFDGPRQVTADIFSLTGERVATLVAGARTSGPVVLAWDGCRADGRFLPTGLYLVRAVLRSIESDRSQTQLHSVALVRE
jgi:hypothetical protein